MIVPSSPHSSRPAGAAPGPAAAVLPRSEAEIAAAAAAIGLPIPAACRDGVAANLALLERHAGILRASAAA